MKDSRVLKIGKDIILVQQSKVKVILPKPKRNKIFTVKNISGDTIKIKGVSLGRRFLKNYETISYISDGKKWFDEQYLFLHQF